MQSKSERGKTWLLAALMIEALAAFCAFVPLGMIWVYGMILSMAAAVVYAVFWFLKLNHRTNRTDDMLLLFLPVFFYTGFSLALRGETVSFTATVAVSAGAAVLSCLSLRAKPDESGKRVPGERILLMGGLSIVLLGAAHICENEYRKLCALYQLREATGIVRILYYAPVALLGILLTVFTVLLFAAPKPADFSREGMTKNEE